MLPTVQRPNVNLSAGVGSYMGSSPWPQIFWGCPPPRDRSRRAPTVYWGPAGPRYGRLESSRPAPIPARSPPIRAMTETTPQLFHPDSDQAASGPIASMAEYERLHRQSLNDPQRFWRQQTDRFEWDRPWTNLLDWDPPFARWFTDGSLNITVNLLDRHVAAGDGGRGGLFLGGRTGRSSDHYLRRSAGRCLPNRQCPGRSGARIRRSRNHLHAHGSRAGNGDAGLCAPGIGAQRDLRRVFGRCDSRPRPGRWRAVGDNRRRRLAPRQGNRAQGQRRPGPGGRGLPQRRKRTCPAPLPEPDRVRTRPRP